MNISLKHISVFAINTVANISFSTISDSTSALDIFTGTEVSKKDSTVSVSDLNAFVDYNMELYDNDIVNIVRQFKHKTDKNLIGPNQYKRVDVLYVSVGEISGMVYLNNNNYIDGNGRITNVIYDKQGNKVAKTLSELNGYISYPGLKPCDYIVKIDEVQLETLEYRSAPLMHSASVKISVGGDIAEGLDFALTHIEN